MLQFATVGLGFGPNLRDVLRREREFPFFIIIALAMYQGVREGCFCQWIWM